MVDDVHPTQGWPGGRCSNAGRRPQIALRLNLRCCAILVEPLRTSRLAGGIFQSYQSTFGQCHFILSIYSFFTHAAHAQLKDFLSTNAVGAYSLNKAEISQPKYEKNDTAKLLRRVLATCDDSLPLRPSSLPPIDASNVSFEFLSLSRHKTTPAHWAHGRSAFDAPVRVSFGALPMLSYIPHLLLQVLLWCDLEKLYGPNVASRLEFFVRVSLGVGFRLRSLILIILPCDTRRQSDRSSRHWHAKNRRIEDPASKYPTLTLGHCVFMFA